MTLVLTDDQRMIRDEAARLLSERSSSEAVRKIVDSGAGTDAKLWSALSRELGWCSMAIPEEFGGLGLGATELVLLQEICGQWLACVPFWSTACVATPLLLAAASEEAKQRLLPAIAVGDLTIAVAWGALGEINPLAVCTVNAAKVDGGYSLHGHVSQVVDLPFADLVLVPALLDGVLSLFAVRRDAGLHIEPLTSMDATRPIGAARFDALELPPESRIDGDGLTSDAVEAALALAQLCFAAEQAGAARGVMDVTLAYVAERVQFGRAIASFQAIKHRCARLEVDIAEVRALIYGAAANFSADDAGELRLEASGARALASELLFRAAEEAIQLHGGVGFTWEYDPQLYFKRAQATTAILAQPEGHFCMIADALLGEASA
ncbi:acyl-CoA dehydrogenase family protein [Corticibacterium sp. UT-5YL-CI-8]|nr:acyl-CoA dehydrogenase family protein [Tianweitania sp. UT-5YL-CI-8]